MRKAAWNEYYTGPELPQALIVPENQGDLIRVSFGASG